MTQIFYKASKHRFDSDPDFKARAQQGVARLQVSASFWMSESDPGKLDMF
jgi:hypothetical protein